ncbi:MAG TPA: DUF2007 domain-containing protein [Actinomycetota bacterium]|nr:DUF2007 domain-containing protein [Actinomycetota bacterium]
MTGELPPESDETCVLQAESQPEAESARTVLAAAGIDAVVRGRERPGAGGLFGHRSTVWVQRSAADAARALLRGAGEPDPRGPWECPGCGERLEAQFTECWKCGADRPGT